VKKSTITIKQGEASSHMEAHAIAASDLLKVLPEK
jgi:hypothetical protein